MGSPKPFGLKFWTQPPRSSPDSAMARHSLLASLLLFALALLLAPLAISFTGLPALRASPRVLARAEGNLGGDFWAHPWAEELAASPKGDDMEFEDVVEPWLSSGWLLGL